MIHYVPNLRPISQTFICASDAFAFLFLGALRPAFVETSSFYHFLSKWMQIRNREEIIFSTSKRERKFLLPATRKSKARTWNEKKKRERGRRAWVKRCSGSGKCREGHAEFIHLRLGPYSSILKRRCPGKITFDLQRPNYVVDLLSPPTSPPLVYRALFPPLSFSWKHPWINLCFFFSRVINFALHYARAHNSPGVEGQQPTNSLRARTGVNQGIIPMIFTPVMRYVTAGVIPQLMAGAH